MRSAVHVLSLLIGVFAGGCVDTSPDRVKLVADFGTVDLAVAQSSLVTTLDGSFVVNLNLGDLAQESATVSEPPTYQLLATADRSTIGVLDALLQDTTLPVTLVPGGHLALSYVLNDQKTLEAADKDRICAGEVLIAGTLRDSSNGERPLAFDSAPVKASGCP